MTTTKKIKLFVQQFIAVIKGDNAKALGIKTHREADATITAQIAVLTCQQVRLENDIESAIEILNKSLVNNGQSIGANGDNYIKILFNCKIQLSNAQEALEANKDQIEFLKEIQEKLNTEVDEEIEEIKK